MIPMDNYCVPSSSSSMTASSGFHLTLNSPVGLKHEAAAAAALAVDWSLEEQYTLEKGLSMFKDEPQVTKYVKIASTLPDKSVRDVAMRCKWMTQKRRKGEEHSATNVNYRKVQVMQLWSFYGRMLKLLVKFLQTFLRSSMKQMPGIISRMSPLPISINNDLVGMLMTSTRRPSSYIIPSSIHLKQEPRN